MDFLLRKLDDAKLAFKSFRYNMKFRDTGKMQEQTKNWS